MLLETTIMLLETTISAWLQGKLVLRDNENIRMF